MTRSARIVAVALVAALAVAIPAFASGGGAPAPTPATTAQAVRHCPAVPAHHGHAARIVRRICVVICGAAPAAPATGPATQPATPTTCLVRRCPPHAGTAAPMHAICVVCIDAERGTAPPATPPTHLLWRCVRPCPPLAEPATAARHAPLPALWICIPPCFTTGVTGATGTTTWQCPPPCPLPSGTSGTTGTTGQTGTTGPTTAPLPCPLPCLAAGAHTALLPRWCGPGLPPCGGPPVASASRAGATPVIGRATVPGIMCPVATPATPGAPTPQPTRTAPAAA